MGRRLRRSPGTVSSRGTRAANQPLSEHQPSDDSEKKYEVLKQRFAELGAVAARSYRSDRAAAIRPSGGSTTSSALLETYHRPRSAGRVGAGRTLRRVCAFGSRTDPGGHGSSPKRHWNGSRKKNSNSSASCWGRVRCSRARAKSIKSYSRIDLRRPLTMSRRKATTEKHPVQQPRILSHLRRWACR